MKLLFTGCQTTEPHFHNRPPSRPRIGKPASVHGLLAGLT